MYPVKDKQADVKAQEATFHEAKRSVKCTPPKKSLNQSISHIYALHK